MQIRIHFGILYIVTTDLIGKRLGGPLKQWKPREALEVEEEQDNTEEESVEERLNIVKEAKFTSRSKRQRRHSSLLAH